MPHPTLDQERLDALRALRILGSTPEPHLDAVCRIAAELFDVPIVLVLLVDETRIWFKARWGVEGEGIDREGAFCDLTIQGQAGIPLVIPDLLSDPRSAGSPLVVGQPLARFYAGVPLALRSGLNLGTFCIMDRTPRPDFGERETRLLRDLALVVEAHLRLHEARVIGETDAARRLTAEGALRQSEQRFRLLAETSTDVILWSDLDTTRRYVSPAVRTVLGYEPAELVGTRPLDFVHPEDAEAFGGVLDDLTRARVDQASTCQRYRRKDGAWLTMEVSQSLARDPVTGSPTGYVTSLRDVTERKAVEEALRLSEERLALALNSGSDGLWDWNVATGEVKLSDHWAAMLAYDRSEIVPDISSWYTLIHPDDVEHSRRTLADHFDGRTAAFECEYRLRAKGGHYIWILARGKVVGRTADGVPLRVVGTHIDITRRKTDEQRIAHLALHDPLTDLPNRTLFWERLTAEIRHAKAHGTRFAVLTCDLDGFKGINDSFGHPAGDLLLQTIAARFLAVVRRGDTVARLGGDEFAIILSQIGHAHDAGTMATRIIEAVNRSMAFNGHHMSVGISVGIAIGTGDLQDAVALFRQSDSALYQAKAAGKNTHRFHDPSAGATLAVPASLKSEMRAAIRRGDFQVLYQPIVELETGSITGFEALMRWEHPIRGEIAPGDFIPLAEETGLIIPLGAWILKEACREAASWPEPLRVAVNVSAIQFQQISMEETVLRALASSGLPPHRLELEITETVLMQTSEAVARTIRRLRNIGVRIALDDFGTGYSSLSYLHQFDIDTIKIDRSFLVAMTSPKTATIMRAIVALARNLGARVTVEGVETQDQLDLVRAQGGTEVQGYFFSPPLPVETIARLIETRQPRRAA